MFKNYQLNTYTIFSPKLKKQRRSWWDS